VVKLFQDLNLRLDRLFQVLVRVDYLFVDFLDGHALAALRVALVYPTERTLAQTKTLAVCVVTNLFDLVVHYLCRWHA